MNIFSSVPGNFKKEIQSMFVGVKTQEKVKKIKLIINSGTAAGGILIIAAIFGKISYPI